MARTEANISNLRDLPVRATKIPRGDLLDMAMPAAAFFDHMRGWSDSRQMYDSLFVVNLRYKSTTCNHGTSTINFPVHLWCCDIHALSAKGMLDQRRSSGTISVMISTSHLPGVSFRRYERVSQVWRRLFHYITHYREEFAGAGPCQEHGITQRRLRIR